MGFLKTFLIITFPGTAVATFFAFRLGSELPKASRKLGRKIGLGYHYFKVILKVLAPQTEVPAEMMDVLRKTNQQIVSLNRELRANVIKAKQEASKLFPDEIKKNPFEILYLKPDIPIENPTDRLTGSQLIKITYDEKARIINKKKEKKNFESFSTKI